VEKLYVRRSRNIPPVFQTLFQLRNFPAHPRTIGGYPIERHEPEDLLVKADLTLEISDTPDGLSCRFEYPVALFDHGSIVRMVGHWQTLLKDIGKDPDKKLSDLQLLTDEETCDVLQMGKGKKCNFPRENVARLFEARAREYPEAIAIRHSDEKMTYRQVDERSNSLAGRLRESNVRKGDIVVLFMERSASMVIAMLATLKAGGAYLPISPGEPENRIAQMMKSVTACAAITDPGLSSRMEKFMQTVLTVDNGALSMRPFCPEGDLGSDDLAYVMFTSGSTGTPKGVCIPHRGIARLVLNTDYIQISPENTVGHLSDPAFDASTFEIWGALLNGATLAVIDKDVALSPPVLKSQIIDSQIDVLFITTPLFHAIVSEDPSALCGLRYLLVGGEVMDPAHAGTFLELCTTTQFANVYGPTENTTFSTYYEMKLEDCSNDSIPIGRPIANSDVYILDNAMNPVPVGITGEIYVSGDGVALGYLDSPGLTALKFIPDPYVPGQMLYRTGDLGTFLTDGNVRFLGRSDTQVKIRGFRVEGGEVTSVMETHPAVRQAVIIPYRDIGGTVSLSCFLVKNADSSQVPVEKLRQYAAERLPLHMVPAIFTWIDSVPLTSRGKIDFRALPTPSFAGPETGSKVAPDDMASRMASVWRKVMGLQDIGPDDDFFDSGGHSLLAIRLISSIEEEFKIRLPVSAIFTSPTIRSMTALLRDQDKESQSCTFIPLRTGGSRPPLFCIHGVDGTLFDFGQLAQIIGDDQPVYGIQSPGIDGREPPLESVGEMAHRYIRELRRVQPHGPYHLLAYCAGGSIAYEMACRLEREGEKHGVLVILDYAAPNQYTNSHFWSFYMYIWENIRGARSHIREFFLADPETRNRCIKKLPWFILKKVHRFPGEISGTSKERSPVTVTPEVAPVVGNASTQAASDGRMALAYNYPEWVPDLPEPQRTVAMKNYDAIAAYTPGYYHGKITIFMSTTLVRRYGRQGKYSHGFGWKKITTGYVDSHVLKGDHRSILQRKSIEHIAFAIRREIDLVSPLPKGRDNE
jgi:amino acid adenylation domain-containing protein